MGTAGTDTEWAWEVVMADTSIHIMEVMVDIKVTEAIAATGDMEDMEAMATEASLEVIQAMVIQATEVMAMEI